MAYKKITEVNSAEELKNSDSLLVISDGELKQLPSSKANIGGGKFKTGDVVYRTDVPNFHFGVMTWEEFEANPTNSMDTKVPIGLVVDPVKRTFVFCELLWNGFAQKDEVSFWGGYTSFDDGQETFNRLKGLVNKASKCAAYQALRFTGYGNDSVFYAKNLTAYVPALNEWNKVYEPIFYENIKIDGQTLSLMDKFICLKKGEIFYANKYFTKSSFHTKFYSHLSTLCFIDNFEGNSDYNTFVFGVNGTPINYGGAGLCPVFGIYTEEEENA